MRTESHSHVFRETGNNISNVSIFYRKCERYDLFFFMFALIMMDYKKTTKKTFRWQCCNRVLTCAMAYFISSAQLVEKITLQYAVYLYIQFMQKAILVLKPFPVGSSQQSD